MHKLELWGTGAIEAHESEVPALASHASVALKQFFGLLADGHYDREGNGATHRVYIESLSDERVLVEQDIARLEELLEPPADLPESALVDVRRRIRDFSEYLEILKAARGMSGVTAVRVIVDTFDPSTSPLLGGPSSLTIAVRILWPEGQTASQSRPLPIIWMRGQLGR